MDDDKSGIVWECDSDGMVIEDSVGYVCAHCGKHIKEEHKFKMMNAGHWKPTSKSVSPYVVSYHINKLYSLMKPWYEVVNLWMEVKDDPQELKTFVNLMLGLPYKEAAYKPKVSAVKKLRGLYEPGTVPDGVLYLTAGLDVQKGHKNKDLKKPARIEMEILGHGLGYRTWSVDYKVFVGPVDQPFEGAWAKLNEWAQETGMIYHNQYERPFGVEITFMDSGIFPSVVYQFAESWQNTFAIKGAKAKDLGVDENRPDTYRKYRKSKIGTTNYLYLIHTVAYKDQAYRNFAIERRPGAVIQPPGFCDFPKTYPDKYFEQLFWHPKGRPNEALDCRVYGLCAGHVFLDNELEHQRKMLMRKGLTREQVELVVTRVEVLKAMEQGIEEDRLRFVKRQNEGRKAG
jgi:phage terminase large subunit GpA-like protein